MPPSHPRRRDDADLETDLIDRVRQTAESGPTVTIVLSTTDGHDADELRCRQLTAIVRLLRHAVEIRRAA